MPNRVLGGASREHCVKSTLRYQKGAAAIEFAFVFPLLLFLIQATIVYGYLFVVRESIEYAAHKGAEAALSIDPAAPQAVTLQSAEACRAASNSLRWLMGSTGGCAGGRVTIAFSPCSGQANSGCAPGYGQVQITFRVNNGTWLFPQISLPGVGAIPPMPESMIATAVAKLSS